MEIYPSNGNVNIDRWDARDFSSSSLNNLIYSYEWEDGLLGYPNKTPSIKLDINLRKTGSDTLNTILLNPFKEANTVDLSEFTATYNYAAIPSSLDIVFNTSNILILYTDKGTGTYQVIYIGSQSSGLEESLDLNGFFSTTFQDIFQTVMEAIPFEYMMEWIYLNTLDVTDKTFYLDFVNKNNTEFDEDFAFAITAFDKYFYFMSMGNVTWHFQMVFNSYIEVFMQGLTNASLLSTFLNDHVVYKQLYSGLGGVGATVNYKYLLTHISNMPAADYADKNYEIVESLFSYIGKEYNTFWDFFKAVNEYNLYKVMPNYATRVTEVNSINNIDTIVTTLDIKKLFDVEFKPQVDTFGRLTVSKIETVGNDISKYEYSKNSALNDNELNIPLIFHSDVCAYESSTSKNWGGSINLDINYKRNKDDIKHMLSYYYKDDITNVTNGNEFIRCHHYINYKFSDTKYASNYYTINIINALNTLTVNVFWLITPYILQEAMQNEGSGKVLAESLPLAYFKKKRSEISCKYKASEIIEYILNPIKYEFEFDLSELTPYSLSLLSSYSNKFNISGVEWSIVGENDIDTNVVDLVFRSV
jgi:hypothetical protein